MIEKLNNQNERTSCQIQVLFQASYRIEAQLLDIVDFPPLKRKLIDYIDSDTEFYGCWKDSELAAIVEIESSDELTDICSLVVHPEYFRQGLVRQLMQFVLDTFDSEIFTVETGLKNEPAIKLYTKLGFQEEKQWDTEFGIRKIKLVKTRLRNPQVS